MSNNDYNEQEDYSVSGVDALGGVHKPPPASKSAWFDFRQGKGDSIECRLLEIKGTKNKSYQGRDAYEVLVMKIAILSTSRYDGIKDREGNQLEVPGEFMTNPRSAWCTDIKDAVHQIARHHGWNGNPAELRNYIGEIPKYTMRWTRNDNEYRQGHIDVDIQWPQQQQTPASNPWDTPAQATPFSDPWDSMVQSIAEARDEAELKGIMQMGWGSLPPAGHAPVKAAYDKRLAKLQEPTPFDDNNHQLPDWAK